MFQNKRIVQADEPTSKAQILGVKVVLKKLKAKENICGALEYFSSQTHCTLQEMVRSNNLRSFEDYYVSKI